LVWDRIPITIVFMSFFSAIVAERVDVRRGFHLLLPLVALGIGTVLYWRWTESRGAGDLRPYALVQLVPIVLIPLLMLRSPPRYTRQGAIALVLALYVLAKGAELLDGAIYIATGAFIGGHAVKHLMAGAASLAIVWMLAKREPARPGGTVGAARRAEPSTRPWPSNPHST
jgi:hypothetical protein